MTPADEKAFELLEALRAVVAAWWTRKNYTRLHDSERGAMDWRALRRLEDRAFAEEELPPGHTWDVPHDEEVAEAVLPPVESDAGFALPLTEVADCLRGHAVLLLHVVTGDTHHIDDPAAWLHGRGWRFYNSQRDRSRRPQFRAVRAGAWRVRGADPYLSSLFRSTCAGLWVEHLVAMEWERDGDGALRSPSGNEYALAEAIQVHLARGGFDLLGELARGEAAVDRVLTRLEKERQVERAARAMARAQKKASTRKAVPT